MRCSSFHCAASLAALLVCSHAYAQLHNISDGDESISIEVVDPRPLSAALQLLLNEHPLDLTYEEVRYLSEQDIADVTALVRRGNARESSGDPARVLVPRNLVPRSRALLVTVPLAKDSASRADWLEAIEAVVEAQNTYGGGGGRFRVEESAGTVHVMPVAARDESGQWIDQRPILDTPISVNLEEASGLDMLYAICKAVSLAVDGSYPTEPEKLPERLLKPLRVNVNELLQHEGTLDANNELARDVIMRMLRDVNARVNWLVFVTFDPTYDNYWINIRSLLPGEEALQAATISESSSTRNESGGSLLFVIPEGEREETFQRITELGLETPPTVPRPPPP